MAIGAIGGWLYWRFVGCSTGSCPIQQNWMMMTLWGGTMGYLLGDMIPPPKTSTTEENKENSTTNNNQNKGEQGHE